MTEKTLYGDDTERRSNSAMNPLQSLVTSVKYAILSAKINRMPEKNRHKIAKEIYATAYQALAHERGSVAAACAVIFECPYSGHVSVHVEQTLARRSSDNTDVTDYYRVMQLDKELWMAVVIACAPDMDIAMAAADASAMSAVLKAPTTTGTFQRNVLSLENYDKSTAEAFVEENIIPLFEEHQMVSNVTEIA